MGCGTGADAAAGAVGAAGGTAVTGAGSICGVSVTTVLPPPSQSGSNGFSSGTRCLLSGEFKRATFATKHNLYISLCKINKEK
jgi:hypothetical protein